MQCEYRNTVFSGRHSTPHEVRCRRAARVVASVPFGPNALDFCYCRECARNRAAAVLHSRGKVVTISELPADMLPPPIPRDSMGRFLSRSRV